MKLPQPIKCEMCERRYHEQPLKQHEWWSGSPEGAQEGLAYRVMIFDADAAEHLCSVTCRERRIAAVVKPEKTA